MYRLVYVSAATVAFSKADLLDLLTKARDKNQKAGITGMLLYHDGDFLQLIEGERSAVQSLFEVIKADPRHSGTIVVDEEEADERVFADWCHRRINTPQFGRLKFPQFECSSASGPRPGCAWRT